jgi:hypothetical protein
VWLSGGLVRASLMCPRNLRASPRARHNLEADTFGASLVLPFVLAFVLTIVLTFVLTLRASVSCGLTSTLRAITCTPPYIAAG